MTFDEVLDRVLEMLRRRGRVSYRALKRQFDLDDAYVADLSAEIIEVHQCEKGGGKRAARSDFNGHAPLPQGGVPMKTRSVNLQTTQGASRRELLKVGLAAGAALSAWPLYGPSPLWSEEAGVPKRRGILRVRGYDPPHFDPHLTLNFKTNNTLSFVYNKLVRHKVGPEIRPGTFIVEPDLAERWEELDDTTYLFHLRKGVRWHNRPPVNGRELVAADVKFTFDRFLTEKGNPLRFMLESVDRLEVVDRYTVKFLLNKPFLLERYEPNVKTVFTRNPDYFLKGQPYVEGVEWLILEDPSTGLAMYRTGQIDCGPWHNWTVRQQDLDSMKQSHPHLRYLDWLGNVTFGIYMRTDKPPFNDVRVRRAISHAVDRQAIVDAVFIRGEPTPAISRGVPEWSPRIDQLGEGAKYYRYDPKEARRLLAEAGFPKGLKTQLNVTGGYGPDIVDAAQLAQSYLKDVGMEAELRLQEYGAYMATTFAGKFEGMAMGPFAIVWEPHSSLYGMYMPDQPRNSSHVNDPKITAMLKEQMQTKDLQARKQLIFDIQRYAAEQQYYVYLFCAGVTGSWQPYVKNFAPNHSFDYGNRTAALWLDRS